MRFRTRIEARAFRSLRLKAVWISLFAASALPVAAQTVPIAIVPVEGVQLTGALDIAEGKAVIVASGTVTAGDHTAVITLPHRGNLHLCATTRVSLMADNSIPAKDAPPPAPPDAGEEGSAVSNADAPGLLMALDRGALEANFATGKNSDVILTPDFRILISGPGIAQVKVRLGAKGDTCVDNRGPNAPYVTVSSVFDGGAFRVQENQRVMFQHGSLQEVVDNEKESCGCPPEQPNSAHTNGPGNDFPVAQSEGLAPPPTLPKAPTAPEITTQLAYPNPGPAEASADTANPAPAQPAQALSAPETAKAPPAQPKPGFFSRIGRFFRKLFGG